MARKETARLDGSGAKATRMRPAAPGHLALLSYLVIPGLS